MDTAAAESNNHLPMLFGSEFGATIQVEVCQSRTSAARAEDVKMHVMNLLQRHPVIYGDYTWSKFDNEFLQKHVASVAVVDTEMHLVDSKALDLLNSQLQLHVFQLWEDGPTTEELEQDNEALSAASHWLLPAAEFQGLWENLVYDNEIKSHLLQYITTTILFSDMKVDSNIISWNRVVLLHGPPGTGKTSLCKALAQKLSIRLSGRYKCGQLIEINSHSLFSKWFSESGKLVMKMFQKIQDLIDDKESLICVLIDEVESLTASRSSSLAGTEPSDAIRVVNALLTQIDQIKRHSNVIILTTSNVTGKIDMAFVDRADIKQYIGPPSAAAIFKIYFSGLEELMKCHIIHPRQQLLNLRQLERMNFVKSKVSHLSLQLRDIANKSQGLSGRTLRKIPFLAHALFVQESPVTLECFLECLSKTVDRQFCENDNFISPH